MTTLPLHLNPAAIGLIALFASVIWMLRDERDRTRPVLVVALVINLAYGFLLNVIMGQENGLVPWKFDHILAAMDTSLGIDTPGIASSLQGGWRLMLGIVYDLMVPTMIVWYIVGRYKSGPGSILHAYIAEMLTGPLLYAIVPACGPLYAFGPAWLHAPVAHAGLIRLSGMPNAFPSLHVGTAIVFVFCSRGKLWRVAALAMLAGTVLATLSTGEHYAIDLVAGLAFGCFAAAVGRRRAFTAVFNLAVAVGWSFAVRLRFQFLLDRPDVLKLCAAATVLAAIFSIATEWMRSERNHAAELVDDLDSSCQWEISRTA